MSYELIRPPFTRNLREMSKSELLRYNEWFHSLIDPRTAVLEKAVRGTAGYESWQATCRPQSLVLLGSWFASRVAARPRTLEEKVALQERTGGLVAPGTADTELTNETFSLAMDVGMYFARTLQSTLPDVRWAQLLSDKRFADFGQPVLVGAGPVPLNPVQITVVLAYAVVSGRQGGERLRELYDYWAKRLG